MSSPTINPVEATVLTIDIRNFTYHSSPEADPRFSKGTEFEGKFAHVAQAVAQFHDHVTEALRRTTAPDDAVVLSTGDGLIVCFPTEGHGRRAVQLAISLPPVPFHLPRADRFSEDSVVKPMVRSFRLSAVSSRPQPSESP